MVAEGVVRAGRFGGSAREGGGRALPPYSLRLLAACAQVSRDAPPPLPGGYKEGEKVFYVGANHTFPSGNKVVHGQQCEVTGPCPFDGTGSRVKTKGNMGVSVLFPDNKGHERHVGCSLTEVRRHCAASAATRHA